MIEHDAFERIRSLYRSAQQFIRSVASGQGIGPAFAQTLATQVFVLVLNITTGVLTARVLGPLGRGVFTAVTLWPQLMAMVVMLGLNNALVFEMRRSPSNTDSILTAALVIAGLLAIFGALIGTWLVPFFMAGTYPHDVVEFTVFATAAVIFVNLLTMLLRPAFIVFGRIGTANNSNWANPFFYLVIMLLVWELTPITAQLAALCQFTSAAFVLFWMIIKLFQTLRLDFAGLPNRIRALTSYMLRSAPGEAVAALAGNLDRLALVSLIPAADLGLYAVAYSLSRLLVIIQVALSSVALPTMSSRTREEAKVLHDRMFRFTLIAVTGISLGSLAFGGWALRLFYGQAFAPAAVIFKILVLESAIGCLSFLPAQLYLAFGRPGFLSVLQLLSFGATVAALLVLTPEFGAQGAAVAMLISGVFRLVSLLGGLRPVLQVGLPSLSPESNDVARLLDGFRHR